MTTTEVRYEEDLTSVQKRISDKIVIYSILLYLYQIRPTVLCPSI